MMISEERLRQLETLTVSHGSHKSFEEGHCAMELVAWLAGEPHSASPRCACPTITAMSVRLKDRMGAGSEGDQLRAELLRPLLPKIIGTAGSLALRTRRAYLAANAAVHVFAPMALEFCKRPDLAAELRAAPTIDCKQSARAAHEVARHVCENDAASASYAAAAAATAAAAAIRKVFEANARLIEEMCALKDSKRLGLNRISMDSK